ncbi:protein XRI1-like isoform X2 [Aristolochia californica]|uniref:protein XRI1-like isoform X2 n=1 Tax=Aristolochia californica TaxID=171875 RepID=UPI0035DA4F4D
MMDFHNSIQNYPSLDWDLHSFGVLNSDMSALMQSSNLLSADSSSGYLEDAVFQWNDHCKRRRVLLISQEQMSSPCSETNLQDSWRSASEEDLYLNFSWPIGDDEFTMVSDDPFSFDTSINTESSGATPSTEMRTKNNEHLSSPSSSSDKEPAVEIPPANDCRDSSSPSSCRRRRKKAAGLKVAYPFAMVKPGGIEGDVTLGDINERIHMRPTRPIRHPVGEFACVPCVSPGGPGLSGKDVVALNRIHTKGNGTITIIRTRG